MDFLSGILSGSVRSKSSVISGRLSLLNRGDIQQILEQAQTNGDYLLGTKLRDLLANKIGHIGEVFNVDHARPNIPNGHKSNTEARYEHAQSPQAIWVEPNIHEVFDAFKFAARIPPKPLPHLLEIRRDLYEKRKVSFNPDSTDEIPMIKKALLADIDAYTVAYFERLPVEISNRPYRMLIDYIASYEKTMLKPSGLQIAPDYNSPEEHELFYIKIWSFMSDELRKATPGATKHFAIPGETESYIQRCIQLINNNRGDATLIPQFNEHSSDYLGLVETETKREVERVIFRQQSLQKAIEIFVSGKKLTDAPIENQARIKPYLEYYRVEIE